MGLFGGSSKSKSSIQTITNISDDRIAGENAIIADDGATINYLSDQVVDSALAFAGKSQAEANALVQIALEQALQGNKAAFEQIGKSTSAAFEQSATAISAQRSEEFQGLTKLFSTASTVAVVGMFIYFATRK